MKLFVEKLARLHDFLTTVSAVLAAIGLIFIVSSYVFEVVSRYFFNSPTAWVSDFVSYTLAASMFLALPKVTQQKGHVAVTIVIDVLPSKASAAIRAAINIVGFLCLSFAAWISLQENIRQYIKDIETLAITPIPQWWVSSFITFGLALSALYMLRHATSSPHTQNDTMAGSAD